MINGDIINSPAYEELCKKIDYELHFGYTFIDVLNMAIEKDPEFLTGYFKANFEQFFTHREVYYHGTYADSDKFTGSAKEYYSLAQWVGV